MQKRGKKVGNLFLKFGKYTKRKYENLTISKQIVLVGIIIGIISLFLPWIKEENKTAITWNAFNSLVGNVGYILIFIFIFLLFSVLSNTYKEKLKLYSDIDFKNHFIIILSGIFAIILGIIILSFASGLGVLNQYMNYGNGPIFIIISGILIFFGGVFIRKDFKRNNSEIILEKLSQNREKHKQKENMELPL